MFLADVICVEMALLVSTLLRRALGVFRPFAITAAQYSALALGLILIGTSDTVPVLADRLKAQPWLGLKPVGIANDSVAPWTPPPAMPWANGREPGCSDDGALLEPVLNDVNRHADTIDTVMVCSE